MSTSKQFAARSPSPSEKRLKTVGLLLFFAFCCFAFTTFGNWPLPEDALRGGTDGTENEEGNMFVPPMISPKEFEYLVQLANRIPVPYIMPWGKDMRPTMLSMWKHLYSSIMSDIRYRYKRPRTNTSLYDGLVTPISLQVIETQDGFVTTSLAHFLPELLVFSVLLDATPNVVTSDRFGGYTTQRTYERSRRLTATDRPLNRTSQPASVASIVEGKLRELNSPSASSASRVYPRPHDNNNNNLVLCVTNNTVRAQIFETIARSALAVDFQVALYPYAFLWNVNGTPAAFDEALRYFFSGAVAATFIALPRLAEEVLPEQPDHFDRKFRSSAEMRSFVAWYGEPLMEPQDVIKRALESEGDSEVLIKSLGMYRWSGLKRELFMVNAPQLRFVGKQLASHSSNEEVSATGHHNESVVASGTVGPSSKEAHKVTFGCAQRRHLFMCVPRAAHFHCSTDDHN